MESQAEFVHERVAHPGALKNLHPSPIDGSVSSIAYRTGTRAINGGGVSSSVGLSAAREFLGLAALGAEAGLLIKDEVLTNIKCSAEAGY